MKRAPLNYSQRIIIVVGAGIALYFFGAWAMTWDTRGFTGWTGYAPLSNTASLTFPGTGLYPWVRLVIWLIIVTAWVGFSLVTLRSTTSYRDVMDLDN